MKSKIKAGLLIAQASFYLQPLSAPSVVPPAWQVPGGRACSLFSLWRFGATWGPWQGWEVPGGGTVGTQEPGVVLGGDEHTPHLVPALFLWAESPGEARNPQEKIKLGTWLWEHQGHVPHTPRSFPSEWKKKQTTKNKASLHKAVKVISNMQLITGQQHAMVRDCIFFLAACQSAGRMRDGSSAACCGSQPRRSILF